VGPRVVLDDYEKSRPLRDSIPGPCYPGPQYEYNKLENVVQNSIIKSCTLRFLVSEINNLNSVFIPKQRILEQQ